MKLIERKQYLDKMINTIGTTDIKALTDMRCLGKWEFLKSFEAYAQKSIPNANKIHKLILYKKVQPMKNRSKI